MENFRLRKRTFGVFPAFVETHARTSRKGTNACVYRSA